jgi:hypothetical protein
VDEFDERSAQHEDRVKISAIFTIGRQRAAMDMSRLQHGVAGLSTFPQRSSQQQALLA